MDGGCHCDEEGGGEFRDDHDRCSWCLRARLPNYDREEFMRWCVGHARLPSVPVERERLLNTIAVDGSHLPVRVDLYQTEISH